MYMEPYADSRDPLTSDFFMELKNMPKAGEITLTADLEFRPDLISFRTYGTTKLWWVIALYNDRLSYDEFLSGDLIAFPSMNDVDGYYFTAQRKDQIDQCLARRVSA